MTIIFYPYGHGLDGGGGDGLGLDSRREGRPRPCLS